MTTIHDLLEEWIEMRATLQRQLKLLEASEMHAGTNVSGKTTEDTIARIKRWIDELNALLKEYANADRS